MAQTDIWTERLFLRAAEERDLFAFKKFLRDPEAMKYWSTAPHTDIEQTKKFLDNMIKSPCNGVLDFVVCLPDASSTGISSGGSDECCAIPIGKAGIWNGQEIGFILSSEYWGKGYAFEALDAIIKQFWATNEREEATIKADVDPRNKRCLRLLKKLGFVEVGMAKNTYETHIGWCDSVYLEARKPSSH
ncbi:acetyltransferase [Gymnopilus junonius]|uniref:Acetyltransferase n=1 Tax=Gymnopilus junonius TaxID=109634 RepID=A0A9P5NGN4_GYMJU|nr:acetyltransferase [Gymnopilus junonius]